MSAAHPTNGHRRAKPKPLAKSLREAKRMLSQLDVRATIRKHPLPSVALVGAASAVLGLTVGSKAMRMLVSSVGMYALSEFFRRHIKDLLVELASPEHEPGRAVNVPPN
jgi:hypothetical protein